MSLFTGIKIPLMVPTHSPNNLFCSWVIIISWQYAGRQLSRDL